MTRTLTTDVAIVGGGLGGLSAARHLQEKGYEVIVLEHHTKPGGYAHYFRASGYRFEVALHALDGLGPGGWAKPMFETLGISEAVEFNQLDPFYTVSFPDVDLDVTTDISEYINVVAGAFPEEREGLVALFDAIKRIGHDVGRFTADRRAGIKVDQMQMLERYPDMAVAFASNWETFLNRYLMSQEAKAVVTTLWGYLGLPPSKLSAGQFALTLLSYFSAGAWYPTGGSGAMTFAIADAIEGAGGSVLLRNTVTSIVPDGPNLITVATDKGLVVEAKAVISNASPISTAALLPDGAIDSDWIEKIDSDVPALATFTVHLGVARDLVAEGWDHHEFFEMSGYDIEAEYEAIMSGDFANAGMIISNYSVVDPECAPEGKSVIVLTVLAPWDHNDVWGTGGDLDGYQDNPRYIEEKEAVASILIDRAARRIPNLEESIEVALIGTPLTNARYMLQPHGSIYGREQTVANMMNRARSSTPVPNLFLAGAWIGGGGMTAAVASGKSAAGSVSRYLGSSKQPTA
jgi:all-trans-retinol 13,14-reductase